MFASIGTDQILKIDASFAPVRSEIYLETYKIPFSMRNVYGLQEV